MGMVFGSFRAEKKIGRSEASTWWTAVHAETGRKAVVKFLKYDSRPGLSRESLRLLRGEAEIARSLDFPGVVKIIEVGETDAGLYIAMEEDRGVQLDRFMASHPELSHRQAAIIALETAKALAHAHGKGVVHKNLKPTNIFVRPDGSVAVADFGIGRILDPMEDSGGLVDLSSMPQYLAPEQVSGDLDMVDQRTDVYSLGVVLYEMLTRKPAFDPDKPGAIQYKILKTSPPAPRSVDRGIPKDIEAVCLKGMNMQMHKRYWSMAEMAMDLKRFLEGQPVSAAGEPRLVVLARKLIGNRTRLLAMSAAALVLALAGAVLARGLARGAGRAQKAQDGGAGQESSGSPSAPALSEQQKAELARDLEEAVSVDPSRDIIDKRIAALRRILRNRPDYAPAIAHMGFSQAFAGRIRQGMDTLSKASAKDPDLNLTKYFWGVVYFHYLKAPERAFAEWKRVIEGPEGNPETHLARAWLDWLQKKDWAASVEHLAKAQDRGAADWESSFLLGYMNQTLPSPKHAEALKEYRLVINDTAGFPPALYLRAIVLLDAGMKADAEESLEKAVAFAPGYPDACIQLSGLLASRAEWGKALKHLDSAVDMIPDCYEALVRRAECLLRLKNLPGALADSESALKIRPGSADALLARARVHAASKDPDQADRDFTAAVKAAPGSWKYPFEYALFLEGLGSADEAVQQLSVALNSRPEMLEALRRRAFLYFKLKDYENALADYQAVLRLDQTSADAYIGAAYVYFHVLKNPRMARDYLLSGISYCRPDDPKMGEIRRFLDIVSGSVDKGE